MQNPNQPNPPNVGYPPDVNQSRPEGVDPAAAAHAAQMLANVTAGNQVAPASEATIAAVTQQQEQIAAAQQQRLAEAQQQVKPAPAPVSVGNVLQGVMGTDRYFEWVDFGMSQHFQGVPIDSMDRMDLLALCGKLIGDIYQMDAERAAPGQQPPAGAAQQIANQQGR